MQRLLLTVILIAGLHVPCIAQLQPDEVAVVAARGNRDSESLARYYARARKLPSENICLVNLPPGEVCPHETWRKDIRPEIHQWLAEHDPQEKIRCLVTVWGVPLKISAAPPDADSKNYKQFLEAERAHRLELLADVVESFDKVAPSSAAASPKLNSSTANNATTSSTSFENANLTAAPADSHGPAQLDQSAAEPSNQSSLELSRLQARLEAALQSAQGRLANLPEVDRKTGQMQLQRLAAAAGGLNVIMVAINQRLSSDNAGNPQMRSEFDAMRGRIGALIEAKSLLEQLPCGIERDSLVLATIERVAGLLGTAQWLEQQLNVAWRGETGASFDSELSLVMWPDGYQLLRWQPNYLRAAYNNSQLPKARRTLMVSRIDAPTLKLASGLIDTAIAVEKQGLRGKVYIDARGLAKLDDVTQQSGSHADIDRSLLRAAKGLEEQASLEVVLENTSQLFQPGRCSDVALYCGWLSQGKYVDAFHWLPGAVAYHLGGSEAATLHEPASESWCTKLLEHGVCATIGSVYEPYLPAFPRADEFFTLLVRGDLTLVECYYQTQPFNSWMMTLIGDPLYRPFQYRAPAAPPKKPKPAEKRPLPYLPPPPGSEP